MKHLLSAMFALSLAQFALANSVQNFSVAGSMIILPNDGTGDNMSFGAFGPGISLSGGGGTACDWCFLSTQFSPGQSINASIFFLGIDLVASAQVKGVSYGPGEISLGSSSVTAGTFSLPLNDKNFTVSVAASFDFPMHGIIIPTSQLLALNVRPGRLTLTFDGANCAGTPCYFFDHASFITTPEPASSFLFVTGVSSMAAVLLRRRQFSRT